MATKNLKALFRGKDDAAEERREAEAVRSRRISPSEYAKGEKMEGEKESKASLMARGKQLATGKLSPGQYARGESMKKMANGGKVVKPGQTVAGYRGSFTNGKKGGGTVKMANGGKMKKAKC